MKYSTLVAAATLSDLQDNVHEMLKNIRATRSGGDWVAQTLNVAEEAGEFVGAVRRYKGMARRSGTREEMTHELADVIISAFAAADVLEIDLPVAIHEKMEIIFSRGWTEPAKEEWTYDPPIEELR